MESRQDRVNRALFKHLSVSGLLSDQQLISGIWKLPKESRFDLGKNDLDIYPHQRWFDIDAVDVGKIQERDEIIIEEVIYVIARICPPRYGRVLLLLSPASDNPAEQNWQ